MFVWNVGYPSLLIELVINISIFFNFEIKLLVKLYKKSNVLYFCNWLYEKYRF